MTPEDVSARFAAVEQLVDDALENAAHLLHIGCRSDARRDFEMAKRVAATMDARVGFDRCWDWHNWAAWHREVAARRTSLWGSW